MIRLRKGRISRRRSHTSFTESGRLGLAIMCSLAILFTPIIESASSQAVQSQSPVRFLAFDDVRNTLAKYADSGMDGSKVRTAAEWDSWIREQDRQVRSRIDRGVEDSISNLILYGTSFTKVPRLANSEQALSEASVALNPAALARVRQLVAATEAEKRNERVEFVSEFLKRKRIAGHQKEQYLAAILARFVQEQSEYQKKLEAAGKSGDTSQLIATRGTLYAQRGLSVDTSLLPNFAIEDTLRVLLTKGVLKSGSIKRIAVVGPGLDFTDKRDGYDFYPLQTIQPFAVLEAVERLGLGKREELHVVTLDLNAAVNSHVANLAAVAKQGRPYKVQLPRDTAAKWTSQALGYWENFGEVIGTPAKPLAVPEQLPTVKLKAVAITSDRAARVSPLDMNVVAQTKDFAEGDGFDLVVATNILVYYDDFQQALAMSNITRMMNSGGFFLANSALPSAHDDRLKYLGSRNVRYAEDGSYGDDVVVYQRQ